MKCPGRTVKKMSVLTNVNARRNYTHTSVVQRGEHFRLRSGLEWHQRRSHKPSRCGFESRPPLPYLQRCGFESQRNSTVGVVV